MPASVEYGALPGVLAKLDFSLHKGEPFREISHPLTTMKLFFLAECH